MARTTRLELRLGTAVVILLAFATLAARSSARDEQPPSFEVSGDRSAQRGEIRSLLATAEDHRREGRMEDALTAYQRAAGLARETADRGLLADALNNLGMVHRYLADYHLAVTLYSQALDICDDLKDVPDSSPSGETSGETYCRADVLHNLGVCYTYLGELQAAKDKLGDALAAYGANYQKSATLTALATVYDLEGEHEKAILHFRRALVLRHQTPEVDDRTRRQGKAVTLDRLATAFKNAKRLDDAHDAYQRALVLWQAVGDRPNIAVSRANLGWLYVDRQQPDAALSHFEQALPLFEESRLLQPLAHTLLGIGRAYRQKHDLQAAVDVLSRAIEITESLRLKSLSPRLRASFLAHRRDFYELYIDVLMRRGELEKDPAYPIQALQAAERFRARSLLELLNEERAALRQVANKDLLDLEDRLHREMSARDRQRLEMLHREGPMGEIAEVEKQQRYLSLQYEHLKAQLRSHLPGPSPPRPLQARQLHELLDDDTLLLFYALGEERSFLWLVSRKEILPHRLPGREEIETEARNVHEWLSTSDQRGGETAGREAAARLSEILLGPVAAALGDRRLVVVADGLLHHVPFAALPSPGQSDSLIGGHEIVSIPSVSVMATLRRRAAERRPAPEQLAVVADPVFGPEDPRLAAGAVRGSHGSALPPPERLEHSREEGRSILDLIAAEDRYSALGFEANREMVLAGALDRYRLVHFAVHGELHDERPEYSHLVLSLLDRQGRPLNGRLYMHEIDDLRTSAELVVLSACNTALGKLVRGEGLIGMTRSFMAAGASRVLVSLWYVNDEASARLMEVFYRGMLVEGKTAAAALRAAQLWMLSESKWRSPYYWAGFVLQGDWR